MNLNDSIVPQDDVFSYLPVWLAVDKDTLWNGYSAMIDYIVLAVIAVFHLLVIYAISGCITYCILVKAKYVHLLENPESTRKRCLIVIAHPDDEVMFFGPTIIKLKETCDVHMLCLSTGNKFGRGHQRKKELHDSCRLLGVLDSNIMIMNDTEMPDDQDTIWSSQRVARIVLNHIKTMNIEEVYTFDIGGVSGHLNHVSIFYSFARLCLQSDIPPYCKVYLLDTVNILRKYSFFLDANISAFPLNPLNDGIFVANLENSSIIREAMKKHVSQLVWYRKLYIVFSRYIYINTYKELDGEDVQLVLQMRDYNPLL